MYIPDTPGGQVTKYSILAGATCLIPVPGIAVIANAGIQLAMYFAINDAMNIKLSKNKVKCIGSFLISQIAGLGLAGLLELGKFIPLLGVLTAFPQCILVGSTTYACGMAYLKILEEVDLEKVADENLFEVLMNNAPSKEEWEKWKKQGAETLRNEKNTIKSKVSEAGTYADNKTI